MAQSESHVNRKTICHLNVLRFFIFLFFWFLMCVLFSGVRSTQIRRKKPYAEHIVHTQCVCVLIADCVPMEIISQLKKCASEICIVFSLLDFFLQFVQLVFMWAHARTLVRLGINTNSSYIMSNTNRLHDCLRTQLLFSPRTNEKKTAREKHFFHQRQQQQTKKKNLIASGWEMCLDKLSVSIVWLSRADGNAFYHNLLWKPSECNKSVFRDGGTHLMFCTNVWNYVCK